MVQVLHPTSDVASSGNWDSTYDYSTTNLFSLLDEVTPNDDYYDGILSRGNPPYTGEYIEFGVGVVDPAGVGTVTVRIRCMQWTVLPRSTLLSCQLRQGGSVVAQQGIPVQNNIDDGFETVTFSFGNVALQEAALNVRVMLGVQPPEENVPMFTINFIDVTASLVPVPVTVTPVCSGSWRAVAIAWDAVEGAEGYYIERDSELLVTLESDVLSYSDIVEPVIDPDDDPPLPVEYCYEVFAIIDGEGESIMEPTCIELLQAEFTSQVVVVGPVDLAFDPPLIDPIGETSGPP
jgi:hypothetical protein